MVVQLKDTEYKLGRCKGEAVDQEGAQDGEPALEATVDRGLGDEVMEVDVMVMVFRVVIMFMFMCVRSWLGGIWSFSVDSVRC